MADLNNAVSSTLTATETAPVAPAASSAEADAAAIAAVASRRRNTKRRPAAGADTTPAGAPPALVDGDPTTTLVVSRTLVSSHLGAAGPPLPGRGTKFTDQAPLVLESQPVTGDAYAADERYVVAACDAEESHVPPGCTTPVSRLLWFAGDRVLRTFYDDVMAAHAARAADGIATDAQPAALPAGRDALPVDAVTPVVAATTGAAPAVATPVVIVAAGPGDGAPTPT